MKQTSLIMVATVAFVTILLSGWTEASSHAVDNKVPGTRNVVPADAIESLNATKSLTKSSPDNPLAGTSWRLVEFQSMDDAIGTLRPDDTSLYTMRLNSDGTVNLRLNCNRASGTWVTQSGLKGPSGHFEFGPLAATHALCPPPSMDESIAVQAKYIRSYLLQASSLSRGWWAA